MGVPNKVDGECFSVCLIPSYTLFQGFTKSVFIYLVTNLNYKRLLTTVPRCRNADRKWRNAFHRGLWQRRGSAHAQTLTGCTWEEAKEETPHFPNILILNRTKLSSYYGFNNFVDLRKTFWEEADENINGWVWYRCSARSFH